MSEEYSTKRLLMRQWRDEDRQQFAAMNNDPEVMRYFPRKFTREESDASVTRHVNHIADTGWGIWAVEKKDSGEFIGFVGFSYPGEWHPCAGKIEIGWRLGRHHWGLGFATEAANFALKIGFDSFGFEDVVSFTSECNLPSIKVMEKIGMIDDGIGFEHPRIDIESPLRKHVVYRISRCDWQAKNQ